MLFKVIRKKNFIRNLKKQHVIVILTLLFLISNSYKIFLIILFTIKQKTLIKFTECLIEFTPPKKLARIQNLILH